MPLKWKSMKSHKLGRNNRGYQPIPQSEEEFLNDEAPVENKKARRSTKSRNKNQEDPTKSMIPEDDWLSNYVFRNLMPELDKLEERFWNLVEEDNVEEVKRFLKEKRTDPNGFNINCKSYLGKTPLTQAVLQNNIDMVEVFLQYPEVEIREAILYAIDAGNLRMTRKLLDFARKFRTSREVDPKAIPAGEWEFPGEEATTHCHWSRGMTPLILAGQKNNYSMIKMLLRRGHVIEMPHTPSCVCKECAASQDKGLDMSRARVNAFKAISSPAYVFLTSRDPIIAMMRLKRDLELAAKEDPTFDMVYQEMADTVDQLLADFIDCCETTEEVQTILQHKSTTEQRGFHNSVVPRLELGVFYEMKRFVAHTSCQVVLMRGWCGEWKSWRQTSNYMAVIHILLRIVFMPLFALLDLFLPFSGWGKWNQSPCNKMLLFFASYVVFLCLIVTHIEETKNVFVRGPPQSNVRFIVVLYVFGLGLNLLRRLKIFGFRHAFGYYHWNKYDTIMLSLFMGSFGCWVLSWFEVQQHDHRWRYQARMCWTPFETTLWAEGLFTLAACMAYVRLMYWFQLSSRFGPIGVSLRSMFDNALSVFAITICLLWISFAHALSALFPYYYGQRWVINGMVAKRQDPGFTTFETALKSLFWAILGMMPFSAADVVIDNLDTNPECGFSSHNTSQSVINQHKPTEWTSHLLYAIYHILTTVITMNMLIAVMSNTFTEISASRSREWKFNRTKFYLEFMNKRQTLPPPYNLIPSPATFFRVSSWLVKKCQGSAEAKCNAEQCCYTADEVKVKEEWTKYTRILAEMVQRYFARHAVIEAKERGGEERLKHLFKNLRAEVKELRRVSEDLLETLTQGGSQANYDKEFEFTVHPFEALNVDSQMGESDVKPTSSVEAQPDVENEEFTVFINPLNGTQTDAEQVEKS